MKWDVPEESLRISRPVKPLRIALLGCGEIANLAHLPAYGAMRLEVCGCYDVRREAAEETATRHGIARAYEDLDEAVADAEVVDIAFHVEGRLEAVLKAAEAGKHVLIQKPISHTLEGALQIIEAARAVRLQVIQQARWAGVFRLAKTWMDMGAIGPLNFMRLDVRGWQDDPDKWHARMPNMTMIDHGVHYSDLLRFFAGRDALSVAAAHANVPGQSHVSPTIYSAVIDFGGGLTACHSFNNKVEAAEQWGLLVSLDGQEGSIFCDFNTAKLSRRDGAQLEVTPATRWFPDAFAGPMADLMDAVAEEREPACPGEDNLGTMKLAIAALQSAQTGEFVSIR